MKVEDRFIRWTRQRLLSGLLAAMLMLTAVLSVLPHPGKVEASTVNLVDEDFENTPVGSVPNGWTVSATGSSSVTVEEATYGEHMLHIYDASQQSTQGVSTAISPQTGKVTIEADIQLPAGGTPGKENMLFYLLDSTNKPAVALSIKPDSITSFRTTSSGTISTTLASNLQVEGWRSLMIEADAVSKTFQFYLNGVLQQADVPFRYDDALDITKLQIIGAYYSDEAHYIRVANVDNVKIYEGEARLPEPSSDLVNETFDAMAVDTVPPNWGVSATGDSFVKVLNQLDTGDHYLQIHDESKQSTQGIKKSFDPQTGELTVQADVQLPIGATANKANILFYLLDQADRAAVAILLEPGKISSFQTTDGTTTQTTIATGLPVNEWRNLIVDIDYPSKTFDVYMNGTLAKSEIAFRYTDALNLSKLQVAGAYYSDDANYTRIVNMDNVRIYAGPPDLPPPVEVEPAVPPAPGIERNSFDSYSSVFLSSRWYHEDGEDGQLGTLDMIKRFMVTDDKWTYLDDQQKIANIVRQGVSFQGTLNMNLGTNEGRAKAFDGTPIVAPWMTWGATWGSVLDPVYYQLALDTGKRIIDAGASGIQFDDWAAGVPADRFGGDFSAASMEQFTTYLSDHYSAQQLADWGIADIATFNYKSYLQTQFSINTNDDYAELRGLSPLNDIFSEYQYEATVDFHGRLHSDLQAYAGRPFEYSNNAPFMRDSDTSSHFLHDLFSYGMGESAEATLSIENMVTKGSFATGLGKPQLISPLPQHSNIIRQAIAAAYSTGQYMLIPWDIWLHGSTRYFGTEEEYGDLYHFIRQYSFLFDGYEVPAKTGILAKWDEVDFSSLKDLSMSLFSSGVPFRDIVTNPSSPHYELQASQLDGLDTLIAFTPISQFSAAEQQLIANSSVQVITVQDVNTCSWLADRQAVSIDGADNLYATVRTQEDEDAPKMIHVLNRNQTAVNSAVVTIADDEFFGGTGIEAVLYRPNSNPLTLPLTSVAGDKHTLTIPKLYEWGIIRIRKVSVASGDEFALPVPWSPLNIGNPAQYGDAQANGGQFTLSSDGAGFNLHQSGDSGASDQLAYVYQHLEATPLQDFVITAKIDSLSGLANGQTAGLMVRETPASNARFVAAEYVQGSGLQLRWRDTDNGQSGKQLYAPVTLPGYVKLEKHEGIYSMYYSSDGLQWGNALGSHTISMDEPLGGMFVAGTGESGIDFENPEIQYGDLALPPGQLTGLALSAEPDSIEAGDISQLTVTASVYNGNSTIEMNVTKENIVYSSSDTAIATIDSDGIISGKSPGSATITASFTAGGTTVTDSLIMEIMVPSPYYVDESFDSYMANDVPQDWTFTPVTGGGSYIEIADLPSTADKSLKIYDNSSSGFPSASVNFDPLQTPFVLEMDFMVNLGENKETGGAIVAYLQTEESDNAISLLVDNTGFWYLDGSDIIIAAPVIEDEWNHIRLVADPSTDKMDLILNGTEVVSQGNFRNATDVISKLLIGGSTSGLDTTAYWDNIRIFTETAFEENTGQIEEPTEAVTFESLIGLTNQFILATGGPEAKHVSDRMIKDLVNAQRQSEKGHTKQKEKKLQDYRDKVLKQTGVQLTQEQSEQLIAMIQLL